MGTVDDRVGALEVRGGEHAVMLDGLREGIASLDRRIGSLEARMDERFTALESRMDQRFALVDQRFLMMDQHWEQRFAKMDDRFAAMEGRFITLDARMERRSLWTIGVQMTTFVTLMAAFVAAFIAR